MRKFLGLAIVVALSASVAHAGPFKFGKKQKHQQYGNSYHYNYGAPSCAAGGCGVQMAQTHYYSAPAPVTYYTTPAQTVTPSPQSDLSPPGKSLPSPQ